VSAESAGALFRLHVDDDQRFAGLLLGAAEGDRLVHTHDEDWFRNPRASDELRAGAELSPVLGVERSELENGARLLQREILGALD
jgi:hypothetical protein